MQVVGQGAALAGDGAKLFNLGIQRGVVRRAVFPENPPKQCLIKIRTHCSLVPSLISPDIEAETLFAGNAHDDQIQCAGLFELFFDIWPHGYTVGGRDDVADVELAVSSVSSHEDCACVWSVPESMVCTGLWFWYSSGGGAHAATCEARFSREVLGAAVAVSCES